MFLVYLCVCVCLGLGFVQMHICSWFFFCVCVFPVAILLVAIVSGWVKFLLKRDLDNWIRYFFMAGSVLCNVDLCLLCSVRVLLLTMFDLDLCLLCLIYKLSLLVVKFHFPL